MSARVLPLEIVSWPSTTRGVAPVYWILERQGPARVRGGGLNLEMGEVSVAILGPYHTLADAGEGLRREVQRRSGLMLRECAYCRRVLGATPCLERFSGCVTHGTCPDCDGKLRRSLGLGQENEVG